MSEHKAQIRWLLAGDGGVPAHSRDKERSSSAAAAHERFLQKEYSRDHQIEFSSGQRLLGSAAVGYNGSPEGVDPEAMLTAALSACHMLTFLALCSVKGFVALEYEDDASGTLEKNSEGKMVVSRVVLRPLTKFAGSQPDPEQLQMMHERAHKSCFISNSVRAVVDIEPRI